jgi:hypothetical protein
MSDNTGPIDDHATEEGSAFRLAPLTMRLLACNAAILICYVAFEMAFGSQMGQASISDFEVFHLAGDMIRSDGVLAAYDVEHFSQAQVLPQLLSHKFLYTVSPDFI